MQQRPRHFAGRHATGDQRQLARGASVARLHRAARRRRASAHHAKISLVLAWVSPDGKTLAFVGERNGDFDIYAIPAAGGEEKQLTTAKGLDDGPEYSLDGKYIYFNSERTGHMQIWRMRADGSEQEQVTFGEENDWFPHISPDGQQMVFVTFDASVKGHPENKDVMLRMMSLKDKKITVLAKLFGGQGMMNVPSWSPDGKQFAFVSYQLVPKESAGK